MSAGRIELGYPSRGHVTQRFAQRQLQDGQPHAGQDWAYRNNDTGEVFDGAYAMADGVVVWADDTRKLGWPNPWYFNPDFDRSDNVDTSAGNAVVLRHWFGDTTYCHLEETPLNIGDRVKRGQRVGTVGATGYSSGKHLHSDLILNGADVSTPPLYGRSDPNPYFTSTLSAQGDITPIQEDELSAADVAELKRFIQEDSEARHLATRDVVKGKELSYGDRLFIQTEMERRHQVTRDVIREVVTAAITNVPGASGADVAKAVADALAGYELRLTKAAE